MNASTNSDWACEVGRQNVGPLERGISGVLGGWLLSQLSVRSLFGGLAAAVGVSLLYRSITGHCPVYERLGVSAMDTDEHAEMWSDEESGGEQEHTSLSEMHSKHGEITNSRPVSASEKSTARARARS